MQLNCRNRLSRPTLKSLTASLGDFKKGNNLRQQFKKRIIERKTRILIQVLPWVGRGAMDLRFIYFLVIKFLIPLSFLYISFIIYFFIPILGGLIFLTIFNYWDCILTFHLDIRWYFFGYLSHRCFASGGRVGCRLCEYCLGVILPLMQQVKLVQCIKCRGDRFYMSLLLSSAFSPMVLVVCLKSPKERMLLGLLGQAAFLSFTIWIIFIVLGLNWWIVGPTAPQVEPIWWSSFFRLSPPTATMFI